MHCLCLPIFRVSKAGQPGVFFCGSFLLDMFCILLQMLPMIRMVFWLLEQPALSLLEPIVVILTTLYECWPGTAWFCVQPRLCRNIRRPRHQKPPLSGLSWPVSRGTGTDTQTSIEGPNQPVHVCKIPKPFPCSPKPYIAFQPGSSSLDPDLSQH